MTNLSRRSFVKLPLILVTSDAMRRAPEDLTALLLSALSEAENDADSDGLRIDLAFAFARAGDIVQSLKVARQARKNDSRDAALYQIAAAQAHAGDPAGAIYTIRSLHNRAYAVAVIAVELSRSGNSKGAVDMIKAELADSDQSTYALRLLALERERAKDYTVAEHVYKLVATTPRERARSLRASAYARLDAGDVKAAGVAADNTIVLLKEAIAADLKKVDAQFGFDEYRFSDDIRRSIAEHLSKMGNLAESFINVGSIKSDYLKSHTFTKIASIRASLQDLPGAKDAIARASAIAARDGYRGFELADIAAALARVGEIDRSRSAFLRALGKVGAVGNQASVIALQAEAGDIDGAIRSVEMIPEEAVREEGRRIISRVLANASDFPRALKIAETIHPPELRAYAFLYIAERKTKAGDRAGAVASLGMITSSLDFLDGDTIRAIAHQWSASGDVNGAVAWARGRTIPKRFQARALLGVAEGMLFELQIVDARLENP